MAAKHRPSSVFIYSDCLSALEYLDRSRQTLARIKRFLFREGLVGPGIIAAEKLSAIYKVRQPEISRPPSR